MIRERTGKRGGGLGYKKEGEREKCGRGKRRERKENGREGKKREGRE